MAAKRKVQLATIYTMIAIVGMIIGSFAHELLNDERDPIEAFLSAEALNSPVNPGEKLTVRINRIKVREDCPVTSIRSLLDANGKMWPVPAGINLPGGDADKTAHVADYTIPGSTPVGEYELRVHLIYDCGTKVFHHDQPNVPFCVGNVEPSPCERVSRQGN